MAAIIGRMQTARELEIVGNALQRFAERQVWRSTFATQWDEIAELIDPNSKNTFHFGNFNWPGQKKTQRQVDASGMMALHRFGAILDSLLTPRNMQWHTLAADNDDVMRDRAVRLWFERATKVLFQQRYKPHANFSSQNQQNYQSLGAYGTGNLLTDIYRGHDGSTGFRYKALRLGEMFLTENHQGQVDGFTRWFRLTARQALQVKAWRDRLPEKLIEAAEKNSESLFDFIHEVGPNDEYDPDAYDFRGKKWKSCYISLEGKALLQESGYSTFPVACSRYDQGPAEVYGRGPAGMVLPALKTLNAEKTTFLTQGHRAANPPLLTADDGLLDPNLRPGSVTKGGVNSDGRPLVVPLATGSIQTTQEMMQEERALIDSAFLVDLFKILLGDPKIFTATQIVEMVSQRGILIAPTVGRQQSEYLGPLIDRELDLAVQLRLLPPMPPLLAEAKGEYKVVYTSPLSREMRAQEVAGLTKTLEIITPVVTITQDPAPLDRFNWDKITPAVAEINAVPESWMASDQEVAAKVKNRADAAQRQEQIQAAPAAAAVMKAQTRISKGQVLNGAQG